jgi:mono/diheme cytochrome c family protein/uncharacterized membrane protein
MKWWISAILTLAIVGGLQPPVARAQPTPPQIGDEVRGIFAAKCASCHGPKLAVPRGRFGYVLDLKRIAANPEMVIPERPTESELWVLIDKNEMPPAGHGSLTSAQKEIVRAWIAAGAPDASTVIDDSRPSVMETVSVERILGWLGRFHLLLLHFPIALVFAAGIAEIRSAWRRSPIPSESVRFCLWLGALTAIPTAALGWLFASAGNGADSPQLLMAHRWLGTTAASWLFLTALCAERDAQKGVRSRSVRFLLVIGVLITALVAHLGGLLGRGEDFFRY